MKRSVLFVPVVVFFLFVGCSTNLRSVVKDHGADDARWTTIDSLDRIGQYAAALALADEVLHDAHDRDDQLEEFRAWMYVGRFQQYTGVARQEIISDLEERVVDAPEPLRSLLHSVLGNAYWEVYQEDRWRILERTATRNDPADMDTWSQKVFMDRTLFHFRASLEARDTLIQLPVESLRELLSNEGDRALWPTVYDLLAHRALDLFTNTETRVAEPAWRYRLDRPDDFALFEAFAFARMAHRDSSSWEFQAMQLFKDLTRLHLSDGRPDALVDLDLKRLSFVRQQSLLPEKDSLYLKALTLLRTRLPEDSCWSEVTHALAEWHLQQASRFQRLAGDDQKHEREIAVALCDSALARFPGSFGARRCAVLKANILMPDLQLVIEEAMLTDVPFKVSVQHTQVPALWWRIVTAPVVNSDHDHRSREDLLKLLKLKPLRTGNVELPDHRDLNGHVVELPFEGLAEGSHILIASSSASFDPEFDLLAHANVLVTRIGLIERQLPDNSTELLVLDRGTGRPMEGAVVKQRQWMREQGDGRYVVKAERTTDAEGRVVFPGSGDRGNVRWEITSGTDRFISGARYMWNRGQGPQQETTRTFLFTDRSIYRPGQPIHFKGIMVRGLEKEQDILTNTSTSISLFDVNGEKVSELAVITDMYGTFQGIFTAPAGTLTGMMRLEEAHGSASVLVEEYKRPTFEVGFDPVAGSPVMGEMVTVSGAANSYAGVPLDGGIVHWRVTRTPRMPWWSGWHWRSIIPWGTATELANGVTTTDAQGHFVITFLAQAAPTIPRAAQALFDYSVEASVTDISGETQGSTTQLTVGEQRFQLEMDLGESLSRPTADSLRIKVKNMNGESLDIPVHVKIQRLVAPAGAPYRMRGWEVPDGFVMTREEHSTMFPGQAYAMEEDPLQWAVESTMLDKANVRDVCALTGVGEWKVGDHRVELTATDGFGDTIRVMKHVVLYDPDIQWTGFGNEAFHVEVLHGTVDPGDKAELLISTALPAASILMEVERQGVIAVRRRFALSNGQQKIQIPVQEADRGGIVVHFVCAERGLMHRAGVPIAVPWSNKDLQVEWMSFRDKLLPGSLEEWRLKITGPKGEPVAAQLLTAMVDASLDQFAFHQWNRPDIWPTYRSKYHWAREEPFSVQQWNTWYRAVGHPEEPYRTYPWLNTYGFTMGWPMRSDERFYSIEMVQDAEEGQPLGHTKAVPGIPMADASADTGELEIGGTASRAEPLPPPVIRTDLRETAFFFPDLLTDPDGAIVLRFKTPDALTRWKVLGMAHTAELQFAQFNKETVTQRPLMVVPNLPRFLRQGDRIILTAKVNALEQRIEGPARLDLLDPFTNASLNDRFGLTVPEQTFIAAPGESAAVQWELHVPEGVDAVSVRMTVKGGGGPMGGASHADGEERMVPVLTDRVLVTESLPLPISSVGTKQFALESLVNSGSSSTLRHHRLELEFTPDPVWYAVQALPYMMEFPHECAEQVFSRYYANRLAGHLTEKKPRIKEVFAQWKEAGPDAFMSALDKNSELKGIVLEETPWLLNARDEQERKERIAVLFDVERMSEEEDKALRKLLEMQRGDGAWSWFSGMDPSRQITQHIVAGMGHLEALGASDLRTDGAVQRMLEQAVQWLDDDMYAEFEKLRGRLSPEQLRSYRPDCTELQYLYARSFFLRMGITSSINTAVSFYRERSAAEWLNYSLHEQGMIALALHRFGDTTTPVLILASLKQRATVDDELGMYWKGFAGGIGWAELPTETHAMMIEAFNVVTKDEAVVKQLRMYLLKLKQTTDWKTTKATAEAVYALLLGSDEGREVVVPPVITVGGQGLDEDSVEAGTGYFSRSWQADEITPQMGNVSVTSATDRVAWGALHWQYFEQMDKVAPHESPFNLTREVMLKQATDAGPMLVSLDSSRTLRPGDELVVRLVLSTDRWLDFVHLKDLRAAALEPVEKLSGHRYQGGLGYYQSIKDASMHFFFDRIGPGTYVFEYSLRVTHTGDLSNGITTAMCMYAPEFSSHSAGLRISIGE